MHERVCRRPKLPCRRGLYHSVSDEIQDGRRTTEPAPIFIGCHVPDVRDEMRLLRSKVGEKRGEFAGRRDDQTVMIPMLRTREAEIDLMPSLQQGCAGRRARMVEFERRLAQLESAR